MKKKLLNTNCDYNDYYNINLSFHLVKKNRLLEPDKIRETAINGKCLANTKHPKICKKFYFGKENETYFVVYVKKEGIKVITAWKIKGR